MNRILAGFCVVWFNASVLVTATEPWADVRMPHVDGLVLWLDANASESLVSELGTTPASAGSSVSVWRNAAGSAKHAAQVEAKQQPLLTAMGTGAPNTGAPNAQATRVLRFDGVDDHLRIPDFNEKFRNVTLFLVAAPHSNSGSYRGLLATNQVDHKDYESGFTIDLNASYSAAVQDVNVEGRGFGGARNLLKMQVPFKSLHTFETVIDREQRTVSLSLDGKPQGAREYSGDEIVADQLNVASRFFNNQSGPQQVVGFLHGDIAEVLLFNCILSEPETKAVRDYLDKKYESLQASYNEELRVANVHAQIERLETVPDPPAIQMLVPGFTVTELPIDLTNINNLRYRPDGKLYALGYDGNLSLLSDQDGDGAEDTVVTFFENKVSLRGPIGLAVIPDNHPLLADTKSDGRVVGHGVVVASKGKISAILDLDGDDVAETERVIATGWKEIPQNVDAVGVAIHPDDGAIYFGLGTAAYNNAYLLDENGKSAFDLASERGTIQRIAPDLSSRSTVCTGVRFPIGMEFDASKELFISDQEGATWLPNGNPFDELLHIQLGKHYGFPPRHPKHLPSVLDEPSVFDYAPQHQSTCGMIFNQPLNPDGPIFGPEAWRGDLIVCGESRGKLYRTRLIRNADGRYVADNQLIGCLKMLTVDCCVTPRGDLLVACHSGGPDWGTGPSGKGKIFRIRYLDREASQPLIAWASGPQEVKVAFDRPLDAEHLKNLASQTTISYGDYVAAGDRFESIRPGYAVTQFQQSVPRRIMPIYSVSVTADRQTLILATAQHPPLTNFAIKLPGLGRLTTDYTSKNEFSQQSAIDLAYSLHGVVATWTSQDQHQPSWQGWLAHLESDIAKRLAPKNAEQSRYWEVIQQPGDLTLATQIDPRGWLYPTVQPNSKLDYPRSDDHWICEQEVRLRSSLPFTATLGELPTQLESQAVDDQFEVKFSIAQESPALIPLTIRLQTGKRNPSFRIEWNATSADGSRHGGPTPLHRLVVPWARLDATDPTTIQQRVIPELAGGSWGRGRQVFLSEEAGCSKCHVAHGAGAQLGPDLSNLIHRDYPSVLRDLTLPSFAINPDFITYTALTHDGRALTGVVRSDAERVDISDKDGKVTQLLRTDIDDLRPSAVSVMPEGIPTLLGPDRIKDLMTFLLKSPPTMTADAKGPAPVARRREEVVKILAGKETSSEQISKAPLKILLVAGKKDHGPGEHDYPAWLSVWSELLAAAPGITIDTAMEWPSPEQIATADSIVFYQKGQWNDERAQAIDSHLAKGRGLVYIHWAVEGSENATAFAERIGLASNAPKIKYRHGPLDLTFNQDDHPIARNFDRVHFHDESYWLLQGDPKRLRVLGTGIEEGESRPLFWTVEPNHGRVFVSILGHYSWTFDDPLFRAVMLRGIAWSAGQPVDRFNDLITLGVELN